MRGWWRTGITCYSRLENIIVVHRRGIIGWDLDNVEMRHYSHIAMICNLHSFFIMALLTGGAEVNFDIDKVATESYHHWINNSILENSRCVCVYCFHVPEVPGPAWHLDKLLRRCRWHCWLSLFYLRNTKLQMQPQPLTTGGGSNSPSSAGRWAGSDTGQERIIMIKISFNLINFPNQFFRKGLSVLRANKTMGCCQGFLDK